MHQLFCVWKGLGDCRGEEPHPACLGGQLLLVEEPQGWRDANLSILDPRGGRSAHEAVSRWTLLPPGSDSFHTLILTVRTGSVNSQLGMWCFMPKSYWVHRLVHFLLWMILTLELRSSNPVLCKTLPCKSFPFYHACIFKYVANWNISSSLSTPCSSSWTDLRHFILYLGS